MNNQHTEVLKNQGDEPTVGAKIRKYREMAHMTQKELGEKCKIDAANIRKYESGKQNPKVETVKKIAGALGIPWGALYPTIEETIPFIRDKILNGEATFENVSQSLPSPVYLMPENEEALIRCFQKLNDIGQEVARERLNELAQLPQYQKKADANDSEDAEKHDEE